MPQRRGARHRAHPPPDGDDSYRQARSDRRVAVRGTGFAVVSPVAIEVLNSSSIGSLSERRGAEGRSRTRLGVSGRCAQLRIVAWPLRAIRLTLATGRTFGRGIARGIAILAVWRKGTGKSGESKLSPRVVCGNSAASNIEIDYVRKATSSFHFSRRRPIDLPLYVRRSPFSG